MLHAAREATGLKLEDSLSERIRIAVPTEGDGGIDSPRSAHFGRAGSFTVVDVVDGRMVGGLSVPNPPHTHGGCGATVRLLADNEVRTVIVVGMGPGPRAAMEAAGMRAFFDDTAATPRQAVEAYLAGKLVPFGAAHSCRGHEA